MGHGRLPPKNKMPSSLPTAMELWLAFWRDFGQAILEAAGHLHMRITHLPPHSRELESLHCRHRLPE